MPAPPPRSLVPNWHDLETTNPFGKGQGWQSTWTPEPQPHHNPCCVAGFAPGTTESAVEELCAKYGAVKDVHLPKKPTGDGDYSFALVRFNDDWDATEAIKNLNGTTSLGGTLSVTDGKASNKLMRQYRADLIKKVAPVE